MKLDKEGQLKWGLTVDNVLEAAKSYKNHSIPFVPHLAIRSLPLRFTHLPPSFKKLKVPPLTFGNFFHLQTTVHSHP